MKKLRLFTILMFAGILLLAVASLLLPQPEGVEEDLLYAATGTPATIMDAMFALCAGVLFLFALKNFKPELKTAYRLVAVGALILGVFTLVDPYIEYYALWDNVFFNTASYLSYFFGSIFTYFGLREFFRRVGLRSKTASLPIIGLVCINILLVYNLLPHLDTWADVSSEHIYNALQVLTVVPAVGYAAAAYMAFRLVRNTGQDYCKAFGWLAAAVGMQALTASIILVMQLTGYDNWYFNTRWYELTYILGNAGLVGAAYQFNAIWLHGTEISKPLAVNSFEIIGYVVAMSSDIRAFDSTLDSMRVISAERQGQQLRPKDQQALKEVYLAVEDYLVRKDKLRSFDRDSLRARVSQHFALSDPANAKDTFWSLL